MQESELGLHERYLVALARQDIEQLRRLYCVATDALGRVENEADRVFGIETYHRIFTPDVIVNVIDAREGYNEPPISIKHPLQVTRLGIQY